MVGGGWSVCLDFVTLYSRSMCVPFRYWYLFYLGWINV